MTSSVEQWSGETLGWRYLAQRLDGSGQPGVWLDNELPLHDVSVTDVLSGPAQIKAVISPAYSRLIGPDGMPLLDEWGTAIYAEADGIIRAGGILAASTFQGSDWSLDVSGFTGYAAGMGPTQALSFVQVDPLDITRAAWADIQGGYRSNLGLILDVTTQTPVRVGQQPPAGSDATASQQQQPYQIAPWLGTDIGQAIDDLAKNTPFDYHERHAWNDDKTVVNHYLDFGYPRIGIRRDLRFVLGENVHTKPEVTRDTANYANHVRVIGAGEGSSTIIGDSPQVPDGRLRRMHQISNTAVDTVAKAQQMAAAELARRLALTGVAEVLVRNTPETPLGSWGVGDEVRIQAELDWLSFDYWFRVVTLTITPASPEVVTMTIARADQVAL